MAKIVTQTIAITVSKLVKNDGMPGMVTGELVSQIEAILEELVPDVVVEATLLTDE